MKKAELESILKTVSLLVDVLYTDMCTYIDNPTHADVVKYLHKRKPKLYEAVYKLNNELDQEIVMGQIHLIKSLLERLGVNE